MSRTLSLHERFSVSRRNVGFPPVVVAAAILELDADAGDSLATLAQELNHRIEALLEQYPLLGCKVVDARTRTPSWAPISPPPTARDILFTSSTAVEDSGSSKADDILSKVLSAELASIRTPSDQQQGPLWRVCLTPLLNTQQCVVSLTCDHVINDGRGTFTLFQLLLKSDQHQPEANNIVINMAEKPSRSTLSIPPASDKIFDFRPSTSYMMGMIFHELVLPVLPLPAWVKDKLRGPAAWPATPLQTLSTSSAQPTVLKASPRECAPVTRVNLFTGPNFISNLKLAAQAHISVGSATSGSSSGGAKAASIHAVIHSLAMTALFAALASEHGSNDTASLEELELCFGSETPVSLRHSTPDTPTCASLVCPSTAALTVDGSNLPITTGNFVSCFQYSTQIRGSDCFWTTTNHFARQLASKNGRKAAKHTMGMLAYIPDARMTPPPSINTADDDDKVALSEKHDIAQTQAEAGNQTNTHSPPAYHTGWEKFFGEKARSSTPFGSSVEISNLGLIDLAHGGSSGGRGGRRKVVACAWAQFKAPVSSAFNMDVVGYNTSSSGGAAQQQTLAITLGARPAAFADPTVFDRFQSNLVRLINLFGTTSHTSSADPTTVLPTPTPAAEQVSFASLTRKLLSTP